MNGINENSLTLAMDSFRLHPNLTNTNQFQSNFTPVHQDMYRSRLNAYLGRKRPTHTTDTPKDPKIQLSKASREITHCYDMIESLRKQANTIASKTDVPSLDWSQELVGIHAEFETVGNRINKLLSNRDAIEKSVNKRQQKRNRIKYRKTLSKQRKQMETKNRSDKCRAIDEWLKKESEKKQETQHQCQKKQQIQNSVAVIRQQIDDATKQLSTLKSLQKLHQLRERQKATKHESSKEFNEEITQLISMWTIAMEKYKQEETTQRKQFITQDQQNDWLTIHFGKDAFPMKDVDNIEALIWNRRLWDEFLTSNMNPWASNIPIGWITPPSNPSDDWSHYCNA